MAEQLTDDEVLRIRDNFSKLDFSIAKKALDDQHKSDIQTIHDKANTDINALVDVYAKKLSDLQTILDGKLSTPQPAPAQPANP